MVIVFLTIGLWYTLWNPIGEGVDEGDHFEYVRYIKERRALPIQPWQDNGRPLLVSMGHHPPLYYTLLAIGIAWIDTRDAPDVLIRNPHFVWGVDHPRNGWNVYLHSPAEKWPWRGTVLAFHVGRGLTLLFGALTLWAVYRIGRLLISDYPWIAVTGMAWLAFNPSFIFMCSAIHHDALMAALYTAGMWWLVRLFDQPCTPREGMMGGLLLGAAMLTKLSGLSLALVYGWGFLLLGISRKSFRPILPGMMTTFGVALLVSGWWYGRNWALYGDPLGWEMYRSIFWFNFRSTPFTWDTFVHELLYQTAQTFWGAFGFMHITLPPTIWWTLWKIVAVLTGIAVIAILRRPYRFFKEKRWAPWLGMAGGFLFLFGALIRNAIAVGGAGHARYLFPGVTVLVLLWALGTHALTAFRFQPLLTGLVSLGLALYAVWVPYQFVIPLYPLPEIASEKESASADSLHICFASAVCIRSGNLIPQDAPGAYVLTLYWEALPGDRPDLFAHLRVQGEDGTTLIKDAFWPIPSFSTIAWEPGTIYRTRHLLQLPGGTPPGTFILEMALTVNRDGEPLPVRTVTGEKGEGFAPIMRLTLNQAVPLSVSPEISRTEELEYRIRLLGYSLGKRTWHPGETITLTLFWQPREAIQPNLVVFVHVLDKQGNLVAQHDGVPDQGRRPTPFWQPGVLVVDSHPVPLPADLPPGDYALWVGMYRWPELQRLRIQEGAAAGNDRIFLETIQVRP
ncbi:MAG: hypothetical protein RML46_08375 [Anaerolineae bacterium]|nr:hypothetical protein [Anaerolineae bacterium]MDW8068913.1 hypothetical protein [Anaerolineae bacterium]